MIRARFGKTTAGRLLIGAGVMAMLIPAVAGCEAGEDAPTLEYHAASSGAQTIFHGISISDVFVLGAASGTTVPAGSSASLFLSLYNGGASADTLTGVTATGAASVAVSGTSVALPVGGSVSLMGPQPKVVLTKLAKPLGSGDYVTVTMSFQHAGQVKLQVPVEAKEYDFATYAAPAAAATAAPGAAVATASASPAS